MTDPAQRQIEHVVQSLQGRMPAVPQREIESAVADEFRSFNGARVREFLPVLIERRLRQQLAAVGEALAEAIRDGVVQPQQEVSRVPLGAEVVVGHRPERAVAVVDHRRDPGIT
jgi:hypothetical protein